MPDDLCSPDRAPLVLRRIEPERGVRRFYSLMIERNLFGTVRLMRCWGRIGTNGQESRSRCSLARPRSARRWRQSRESSGGAGIRICER